MLHVIVRNTGSKAINPHRVTNMDRDGSCQAHKPLVQRRQWQWQLCECERFAPYTVRRWPPLPAALCLVPCKQIYACSRKNTVYYLTRFVATMLSSLFKNVRPIGIVQARNFQARVQPQDDGKYKGQKGKRLGYDARHHTQGLLPRLKIKEKHLPTMPVTMKEDDWSQRRATMGKNDFRKILGDDEHFQQHDLLTHIPDWLRGYRASNEYSVLLRRRAEFQHWKYSKPLKWLHLEQRIKFLYRRINNKYRPPEVELLARSRHEP